MTLNDKNNPLPPQQVIRFAARSHIGASQMRTLLEDRSRAELIRTAAGIMMYLGVVADGIGGENAGERAAEVTVNTIFQHCTKSAEVDIPSMLKNALVDANKRVHSEARRSRRKMNMGSTASAVAVVDGRLYLAHVGDSRIYLIHEDTVRQLTIDHTWENEVVRTAQLSAQDAAKHPRKDEIVRSIGYEEGLEVDLGVWMLGGAETQKEAIAAQGLMLKPSDRILICSDGVTKIRHDNPAAHYIEEHEFPGLVQGRTPEEAVEAILKSARSRKVDDNVSAVIVEMVGEEKARRRVLPVRTLALTALVLGVLAGGLWLIPPLINNDPQQIPSPLIPELPLGVAYLSELRGFAEKQTPGSPFQEMKIEEIVPAGQGVRIRTLGGGGYLRLDLADQSVLFLGADTQIELRAITDGNVVNETIVLLEKGIVLVMTEDGGGADFVVASPMGIQARALGSLMGVSFDQTLRRLHLDCFHEQCALEGSSQRELRKGEHLWMSADGTLGELDTVRSGLYAFAGNLVPAPTAMVSIGTEISTRMPTNTLGPLFVPPTVTRTPTRRPRTRTPLPTSTPTPTATPTRTLTPTPTKTPKPTRTPKNAATDTEVPTDLP